MVRAPLIGAVVVGLAAAASLLWPGGAGPGELLPPERLVSVLPAAWLCWCLIAAGRPGAVEATVLAAPALLAGVTLSPGGLSALPGALAVLAAGGAWWRSIERHDAVREHALPIGAALVLAPPLLRALWAAAGLGDGPIPAALSPVAATAPAWWSAAALALGAAAMAWRGRPSLLASGALVLCVTAHAPAANAQEGAAVVHAVPVFGAHHRPGRFVPVAVEVRSGAAALAGEVRLAVEGGPTVVVPVNLPANGRLRRVVPLTAHGNVARLTVTAGWAGADADPAAQLRLRRPGPTTALVLTVSGSAQEDGRFRLLESDTRTLVPCAPAHLPERREYFEMLDCCVMGAVGDGVLTPGAARAVTGWVIGGGQLVLTDPDLLRRSPEVDRALFVARGADESLPLAIAGLPGHFAQALRRRGLGPRDVVYDAAGRPHHVRFRAGLGGGALLLAPVQDADGRTALTRLLTELAVPRDLPVPTLGGAAISALPPAAPGGWSRSLLALWLLVVPVLGTLWKRSRRLAAAASSSAALVAALLGVAATAPVAQSVTVMTVGAGRRTEQVVHVASARRARLTIALGAGAFPRPLVRRIGELGSDQGVVEWGEPPVWRDWLITRGATRCATLSPADGPEPTLLAVRAGRRLLVSNESGAPLTACLLAWQGRMLDLGAFRAGEVRNVELPDRLPGQLAVLGTVAARDGVWIARALRVAHARLPRGGTPRLLATTSAILYPAPVIAGASSTALPSVLVAPVTGR